MDPALRELMAEGAPDDEVAVVLRLAADRPPPAGVRLVARFGEIATCRLPRIAIPLVRADEAVVSMKAPGTYLQDPDLPESGEDAPDTADLALRDTDRRRPDGLTDTGHGVLVAHIDWGADFAHPALRHADGRTRFAAIWDQGASYDPYRPNLYGYGRIHTAADIDRALGAADPYAALGYHPARGKPAGGSHGSHTLGISAGNGRDGGAAGMAPDATLAFVDLSTQNEPPSAGLGDSASLLEGLHFIAGLARSLPRRGPGATGDVAAPMPLVVNASLGKQKGQHDGKTLTEKGMDAFVAAVPGRAIVQSTGNYFHRGIHAAGLLRPGGIDVLHVLVPGASHPRIEVDLWYPGTDSFTLTVRGPGRTSPVAVRPGESGILRTPGDTPIDIGRVYHRRHDPNNGDNQIAVYLDAQAAEGTWTLELVGDDVVDGRWNAWIERGPGGRAAQARFVDADDRPCCTLGTICNGLRTIAVGAFDAHDPQRPLAPFSSGGPTRDGRSKPDLVAPGVRVLSVRSAGEDGLPRPLLLRMSGTSMAAPVVAGTVALMFSAAPAPLNIDVTRRLLLASLTPPPDGLDAVDRWRHGGGYLDAAAAVEATRQGGRSPAGHPSDPPVPRSADMQTSRTEDAAMARPDAALTCGCRHTTAQQPIAAESSDSPTAESTRSSRDDWRMPAPLPFQFQIPINGGAAGIAVPIGGVGSPFALSVPIGGTPAPVAAPATPAAAEPATVGASSATLGTTSAAAIDDKPVAVAAGLGETWPDLPTPRGGWRERSPGIASLAAADAACRDDPIAAARTTSQLIGRLLRSGPDDTQDELEAPFSAFGSDGAAPSATSLFNAFVYADRDPMRARLQARYARYLTPVARPGSRVADIRVEAGDLLVRIAPGQGHGHVAVVAAPIVCRDDALAQWRLTAPGGDSPKPGFYVQVVEPMGDGVRRLADRWARRLADDRGRVLANTLLLRRRAASDAPSVTGSSDLIDALSEDAAADMRWIQDALNTVLGLRLAVDGIAGPQTRNAIRDFQGRNHLSVDGIAGPRTQEALRAALQANPAATLIRQVAGALGGNGAASGLSGTRGTPDCTTLDHFAQGGDTLTSAHQTQLITVARRMLGEGIRSALITGFASTEGSDIDNFTLGMRRATSTVRGLAVTLERMRPGSSAAITLVPSSRGESDQVAAGDVDANRRVTVCLIVRPPAPTPDVPTAPPVTRVFRIVAKSFIGRVGSNRGSLDCGFDVGPLTIPGASNLGLRALAEATDIAFSENPTDDLQFTSPPPENKGYRLFSRGSVEAEFRGSALLGLSLRGGIGTDAGKECIPGTGQCLQAPPLVVDQAFAQRRLDSARIAFRWGVKGRPPPFAENAFNAICHRDSVFIWHQLDGVVDCTSGTAVVTRLGLTGSQFPSHRAWLDGALAQDITQGPMSALWDSASGDRTRVR